MSYKSPLVKTYLDAQLRLFGFLLPEWSTLFGHRFDLHFPLGSSDWDTKSVSRFCDSLIGRVMANPVLSVPFGDHAKPRFIWAKEQLFSSNHHYHLVVLMDGELIDSSGSLYSRNWCLKKSIVDAWSSALALPVSEACPLVEFVDNGDYIVELSGSSFLQQLTDLFYRTSYLAKLSTKRYGDGTRSHSCSRSRPNPEFNLDAYVSLYKRDVYGLEDGQFLYSTESPEFRSIRGVSASPSAWMI